MRAFIRIVFIVIATCLLFELNIFASEGKFVYNSHNKRDPFVPLIEFDRKKVTTPKDEKDDKQKDLGYTAIKLEGIVYDPLVGSKVIINGKILKAGDKVNSYTVEEILPDRVILDILGDKRVVRLREKKEGNIKSE